MDALIEKYDFPIVVQENDPPCSQEQLVEYEKQILSLLAVTEPDYSPLPIMKQFSETQR